MLIIRLLQVLVDSATQYGNLFNSLLGTGASAGVPRFTVLYQQSKESTPHICLISRIKVLLLYKASALGLARFIAGLLNNQPGGW